MSLAPLLVPSLLAGDHANLAASARAVEDLSLPWLHCDIMDGHFVPNLSFSPRIVRTIRPLTKMFFDVHLMCSRPEILLEPFASAGADQIIIHIELGDQVGPLIWKIRSLGKKVGLAINPPTSIANVQPYLDQIDLLLVMTVNPGFGGQAFIKAMLAKISEIREMTRGRGIDIEVDGGITAETAPLVVKAGANVLVAGSAIFKGADHAANIKALRVAASSISA